jgi:hypothetical protein
VRIFNIVIARTIISLFNLDTRALRLIQPVLAIPREQFQLVAWGLASAVSLILLILWLTFRVDQLLSDFLAPRPKLGSFYRVDKPVQLPGYASALNEGRSSQQSSIWTINSGSIEGRPISL